MRGRRLAVVALLAALVVPAVVSGVPPRRIEPIPQWSFRAVVGSAPPTTRPPRIVEPSRTATPSRPALKQPVVRSRVVVVLRDPPKPRGHGSTRGKASWYCNWDDRRYVTSVCMKRHPDGKGRDLYAAACGKLRRAMGGEADRYWRGKRVGVVGNGHVVVVRLADWCGSEDKLIDLYRDAMDVLGPSSGGYRVTVTW